MDSLALPLPTPLWQRQGKGLPALKSKQLAWAYHVYSDKVKVEPWRRVEFYTTAQLATQQFGTKRDFVDEQPLS
jgi:hypothetical protein